MFTKEYQKILDYIKYLKETPFIFDLFEYCSDIVDKPRCIYCDFKLDGVEQGMSPDFDKRWTKGWSVCFHVCHDCNINKESAIQNWFDCQNQYR